MLKVAFKTAGNGLKMPKKETAGKVGRKFSFVAKLQVWAEGMDYCAVAVPAKITKDLGTKSAVLVQAQVNESKLFKVSLFPVGGGQHFIRIKGKVREETHTKAGDSVKINFTVVDRADNTYPKDLVKLLRAKGLLEDFKSISPGAQNFILRKIEEAVQPATREKRLQKALEAAVDRRKKR